MRSPELNHIGPVQQPGSIDEIYKNYLTWVKTIDPSVLPDDLTDENDASEWFDGHDCEDES